jgi:starch synthase
MKIFVTGTRGIPDVPGGVERHCQELLPRIAAKGHIVFLAVRSSYTTPDRHVWRGVRLIRGFAPRTRSLEAIVHTFVSLLKAQSLQPDIVHIHAIGPSLLTPLARLMGLTVVVTNHGPDYDRDKWGRLAKFVLRTGEKIGGLYANEVIVVSSVIAGIVRRRCRREPALIHNGVALPQHSTKYDFLTQIGTEPGRYVLAVARFVPEKGLHDLVEAFQSLTGNYKLVLAGDSDHETAYSAWLRQKAGMDDRIVLTGYITAEKLRQVYSHARIFVLPSYHEGLPIAVLEAMSYGLPALVSDIPANKEVPLPAERYFRPGDVQDLKSKMGWLLEKGISREEREEVLQRLAESYDWDRIAEQTIAVYRRAISEEVR